MIDYIFCILWFLCRWLSIHNDLTLFFPIRWLMCWYRTTNFYISPWILLSNHGTLIHLLTSTDCTMFKITLTFPSAWLLSKWHLYRFTFKMYFRIQLLFNEQVSQIFSSRLLHIFITLIIFFFIELYFILFIFAILVIIPIIIYFCILIYIKFNILKINNITNFYFMGLRKSKVIKKIKMDMQ